MSSWIRVGTGHLWHRIDMLEVELEPGKNAFATLCGEFIPTTRWEEAAPDDVLLQDQHAWCRLRASREREWASRLPAGYRRQSRLTTTARELHSAVTALAREVSPNLGAIRLQPIYRGPLVSIRLEAGRLPDVLVGTGSSIATAVGDLMATLEQVVG